MCSGLAGRFTDPTESTKVGTVPAAPLAGGSFFAAPPLVAIVLKW